MTDAPLVYPVERAAFVVSHMSRILDCLSKTEMAAIVATEGLENEQALRDVISRWGDALLQRALDEDPLPWDRA